MRGEPPHTFHTPPYEPKNWFYHYNKALHTKGAKITKTQKSLKSQKHKKGENAKSDKMRKVRK